MIKEKFILLASICMFSFMSEAQDLQLESFAPESGAINGWEIQDSCMLYEGENLFEFINGGADIYLEYGFIKALGCTYISPLAEKINVEIYEMENSNAAYGIYTMNSSGTGTAMNWGDESILYDYYLHFIKGSCYVRCNVSRKADPLIDTLKIFADQIDSKIKDKGKQPELLIGFDGLSPDPVQLKYIKGFIALNNIFNFGHGSLAGFDEAISAWYGDNMLFVFKYESERKAREWIASTKGKMKMNHKFSDYQYEENTFSVKDKNGRYVRFFPYKKFLIVTREGEPEATDAQISTIKKNLDRIGN